MPHDMSIVIIHIWKVEVYGEEVKNIFRRIIEIHDQVHNVFVVAFGYIANSISQEIFSIGLGVDAVVTATNWISHPEKDKNKI